MISAAWESQFETDCRTLDFDATDLKIWYERDYHRRRIVGDAERRLRIVTTLPPAKLAVSSVEAEGTHRAFGIISAASNLYVQHN